jgi:hypothetical protein
MEINMPSDPAQFAQAIRGLALDAHHTLGHTPSAAALRRLSRRIELLASVLGDRRGGPHGTWLDSLGREVRAAAVDASVRLVDEPLATVKEPPDFPEQMTLRVGGEGDLDNLRRDL